MKRSKRVLAGVLAMALTCTSVIGAGADAVAKTKTGDTVTRISDPEGKPGHADGIIGEREMSYGFTAAIRDGYLYISGCRNVATSFIEDQIGYYLTDAGIMDSETLWKIVDLITNKDVPHPNDKDMGVIIKVNTSSPDEITLIAETEDAMRGNIMYEGNIYFTSLSSQRAEIFKLDKDDKLTKVLESAEGTGMRASCIYRDYLYAAGSYSTEPVKLGNITPLAVMKKSDASDSEWEQVADYTDFTFTFERPDDEGNTVKKTVHYGIIVPEASAISSMVSFNDELYLTISNITGFVVFRGHPAKDGEKANKYGWVWTEVAGADKDSPNNMGLCADNKFGYNGYDEKLPGFRSISADLAVFNNELYVYDIDFVIYSTLLASDVLLSAIMNDGEDNTTRLKAIQTALENPQRLWKMDTESKKFTEVTGLTELTKGTSNEYIASHGIYNGEFYLGTLDAKNIYKYFGAGFDEMTDEEKLRQIKLISDFLSETAKSKIDTEEIKAKMAEKMAEIIEKLKNRDDETTSDESGAAMDELRAKLAEIYAQMKQNTPKPAELLEKVREAVANSGISDEQKAVMMAEFKELADLAEQAAKEILDPETVKAKMGEIIEKLKAGSGEESEAMTALKAELAQLYAQFAQGGMKPADLIEKVKETIANGGISDEEKAALMAEFKELSDLAEQAAKDSFNSGAVKAKIAEIIEKVKANRGEEPESVTALKAELAQLFAQFAQGGMKPADLIEKAKETIANGGIPDEEKAALMAEFKELADLAEQAARDSFSSDAVIAKMTEIISSLGTDSSEESEAAAALKAKLAELYLQFQLSDMKPAELMEKVKEAVANGGISDEKKAALMAEFKELAELAEQAAGEKFNTEEVQAKIAGIIENIKANKGEDTEAEAALKAKLSEIYGLFVQDDMTPAALIVKVQEAIADSGISDEQKAAILAEFKEISELAEQAGKDEFSKVKNNLAEMLSGVMPKNEQSEAYKEKLEQTLEELKTAAQGDATQLLFMLMTYMSSREYITDSDEDAALLGQIGSLINDISTLDKNDAAAAKELTEKYKDMPKMLSAKFSEISEKIKADPEASKLTEDEQAQMTAIFKDFADKASQIFTKNYAEEILKAQQEAEKLKTYYNAVKLYAEMCSFIRKDTQGFDIFKSADGVNWEVVTDNGFGDKFNLAALSFQIAEDGMYVTAGNPFYGSQLYKISNDKTAPEQFTVTAEPAEAEWIVGSGKPLSFVTNSASGWVTARDAASGKHLGMDIDGGVTIADGTVTFSPEWLASLEEGSRDVVITVEEGSVTVKINVVSENDPVLKGDVNASGKVDVTDIVKVAAHVKNIRALSGDELKRADVNGDGKVNVTDISLIAAHVKGIRPLK
ncbi:dockerin type I domain-containing protein [uncultured Ruminococcus sp.]|uniref:dockerin type I domain-containing protein n=1 Tax=uncultured Ruminococcus sp. TaxID=165186 RepID=UPI0025FE622B|nr:dockerin type I domain-containing protein [uncultured Ruminococcus sp.]